MPSWKDLEDQVRATAGTIWGTTFHSQVVHGRQIDAYALLPNKTAVAIEVTEEKKINKIQDDVNKLLHVRNVNFQQDYISTECLCVTAYVPTPAMRNVGSALNIAIISDETFRSKFLPFDVYFEKRRDVPFGSAVNPATGNKDQRKYVDVRFLDESDVDKSIDDVVKAILQRSFIVFTGEYGTGKSKCNEALFDRLSSMAWDRGVFPLAIDLRKCWGLKDRFEILNRHFTELGLGSDAHAFIKAYNDGYIDLLIDGFDEMGVQIWSDNSSNLQALRSDALSGVRDLLIAQKGGAIIYGRSHYFDSNQEMISSLGVVNRSPLIFKSKEEFSYEEITTFLNDAGLEGSVPAWLPRKPLTCELFANVFKEIDTDLTDGLDQIQFWDFFLDGVCEREAKIHASFDTNTIRSILIEVGARTRTKSENVGPLSLSEIQNAFESVVGHAPIDQASVLLQRLPGLGRSAADTQDRYFLDTYLLDGLRAVDVVQTIERHAEGATRISWLNALGADGLSICGRKLKSFSLDGEAIAFCKRHARSANQTLVSDIICSILLSAEEDLVLDGIFIEGANATLVDLSGRRVSGLTFSDSIIDKLKVTGLSSGSAVTISKSIISAVEGISGEQGVPQWLAGNSIGSFSSTATVSRIKSASMSPVQKVLVAILRKTFFQPGAARKEEALLRGLGKLVKQGILDRVIAILIKEEMLTKQKGESGFIFVPQRNQMRRAGQIIAELTLSTDPIWVEVSALA